MARTYYGSKISDNIVRLNNGCILCQNVPIARTGQYQYLSSELGLDGNNIITVTRKPEDVFSAKALASFEGKAFTDDHPPVDVTIDNWAQYAKGIVRDVRRGTGEDSDKVVADILVNDPIMVSEIEAGKREISAGYECDYVEDESGVYQKNIIGNHVALVRSGRAGSSVRIKDEKPERNMKQYNIVVKLQNAIRRMEV